MVVDPAQIPSTWTVIAIRPGRMWEPLMYAPVSMGEAKELHERGLILMAQRRSGRTRQRPNGHMELVVKRKGA